MALLVTIKVTPGVGTVRWWIDLQGMLRCSLKNIAEGGKANEELIKLLAKASGCPQNQIMIISGATSRIKRVKFVCSITFDQLLEALGVERQHGIL